MALNLLDPLFVPARVYGGVKSRLAFFDVSQPPNYTVATLPPFANITSKCPSSGTWAFSNRNSFPYA